MSYDEWKLQASPLDGQAPKEADSYFGIDEWKEEERIRKLKIHTSEITKQLVLTIKSLNK